MKQPHEYPKRVLLITIGKSPQVITETVYALAVQKPQDTRFIPTQIYAITTTAGKDEIEQLLFEQGEFQRLCDDYGLTGIQFTSDDIKVIPNKDGELMEDPQTPEDNNAVADYINQFVMQLAVNDEGKPDNDMAIHASIAGGRKTMTYYLGANMSLYGRPQDRMSHVLVTSGYENHPQFFYTSPHSRPIAPSRDNETRDAKDGQVMLAEVPFVRMTDGEVPPALLKQKLSYSEVVRCMQALENELTLQVDLRDPENVCLIVNGLEDMPVKMGQVDLMFYLWVNYLTEGKGDKALEYSTKGLDDDMKKQFNKQFKAFIEKHELGSEVCRRMKATKKYDNGLGKSVEMMKGKMDEIFCADRKKWINKAFTDVLGDKIGSKLGLQSLKLESQSSQKLTYYSSKILFKNIPLIHPDQ